MKTIQFICVVACGFWLAAIVPLHSQSYVWTTIASSTNCANVDGTNTSALFRYPSGIALDGAGNCYVADCDANTIRKLQPVGTNWVLTNARSGHPRPSPQRVAECAPYPHSS
jgi:DNA-binding beta-propeller fold protein YncE